MGDIPRPFGFGSLFGARRLNAELDAEAEPGVWRGQFVAETNRTRMKKYRGWSEYRRFLSDCAAAAQGDVLVTPYVAAAILGYSKVSIRRVLDQEEIVSWGWYESDKYHASEIMVSVRSLVQFGLKKGRLGDYDGELPLQAVMDRPVYAELRRAAGG